MGADPENEIPLEDIRNHSPEPPDDPVSQASAGVAEGMPTSGPQRMPRPGFGHLPPFNDTDDP